MMRVINTADIQKAVTASATMAGASAILEW